MSQDKAGLATRKAAVQLLSTVLKEKRPLDESLGRYGSGGPLKELSSRDRAFARAIIATSLRRKGQIEDLISRFLEKPLPKKCGTLKEILMSAVAQIVFLQTPAHAAIDMAVRQCKSNRVTMRFSKLANAILRRISEQGTGIAQEQDYLKLNTPNWLWQKWEHSYGHEYTKQITNAHLIEAPLDLTVKSNPDMWAEKLNGHKLPNGSVRILNKGRIEQIEGYESGEWWIQDVAASLCAPLLGNVEGLKVADLCAAPGGKTAQLAHSGAHVTAVDISAKRLDRLKENLLRLNLKAETVETDILKWQPKEQFDAILLDAPCSATGTIRRHPDIPYLKSQEDIIELAEIQKKALENALSILKPGGLLVYCTCSLEPEEGLYQIAGLSSSGAQIRIEPIRVSEVHGYSQWLIEGCLRCLPFQLPAEQVEYSGMDGFFAARIKKL